MSRFILSGAVASLFMGWTLIFGEALAPLGWSELAESRGGGATAKKCKYTCDDANGYSEPCPEGTIGTQCDQCTLGGKEVTHPGEDDEDCSEDGGWVKSKNRKQNCGLYEYGTCVAKDVCGKLVLTAQKCEEVPLPLKQGEPDNPGPVD